MVPFKYDHIFLTDTKVKELVNFLPQANCGFSFSHENFEICDYFAKDIKNIDERIIDKKFRDYIGYKIDHITDLDLLIILKGKWTNYKVQLKPEVPKDVSIA